MSNIIIIGCGRVGSQLANLMASNNHNVCVIDKCPESFANLGSGFNGSTIQGIGYNESTLVQAGIEEADILAAVTEHDTANLMTAEVASHLYEVPHVIARLYNPDHERAYTQLGIDYVCGTSLVAEMIFDKITSGHGNHIATFGDFEILQFSLDLSDVDESEIPTSRLERERNIRIVAIERKDGTTSSIPSSDTMLRHGDLILACVRKEYIESIERFIQD